MKEVPANPNPERAIIVRPTQQFWQPPVQAVNPAEIQVQEGLQTLLLAAMWHQGSVPINHFVNANGTPNRHIPRPGMREE